MFLCLTAEEGSKTMGTQKNDASEKISLRTVFAIVGILVIVGLVGYFVYHTLAVCTALQISCW